MAGLGERTINYLAQNNNQFDDFVRTRMKKVMEDLNRLIDTGSDDLIEWSSCFSYLSRTYGGDSEEAFLWYKYYLREGKIPATIQLPLLMQIYNESKVDGGFVNTMVKVFRNEPQTDRERRIGVLRKELAKHIDKDGMLCLYRGCFNKPFGVYEDASRPIEKAFTFCLEENAAMYYAACWYPESAKIYTVQVPLEDVIKYNIYQEDKPVFVLPMNKGGSMKIMEERILTEADYRSREEEAAARRVYLGNFGKKA